MTYRPSLLLLAAVSLVTIPLSAHDRRPERDFRAELR